MIKRSIYTLAILSALSTASCVKESLPECPYQFDTQVFVKDKNYANTGIEGVDPISEDLPFKEYVSNIRYTLLHMSTGEVITSPTTSHITGDEMEVSLNIDQVPDGEYTFTVWGNIDEYNNPATPHILHYNNEEGTDLYSITTQMSVIGGINQTKRVGLERAKGKLLVIFNNLPESVVRIDEEISSIYASIDEKGAYSGSTYVTKTFLKENQSLGRISTFLSPTIEGERSVLSLDFYTSADGTPAASIPGIETIINKNETTVLVINYNSLQRQIEVWDLIDGEWTLIIKLDV